MTQIRLSPAQQQKIVRDFDSSDNERQKDAIAVCCEHDLNVHDLTNMIMKYDA